LTGGQHVKQGSKQDGLELVGAPGGGGTGPINAQDILRRHFAPLAEIISQFARISAVLVDDDDRIETTAAGVSYDRKGAVPPKHLSQQQSTESGAMHGRS
jgi:hypothetical protein